MLVVASSTATAQGTVPNLPASAACFPTVTVNRLTQIQTRMVGINEQLNAAATPESKAQFLNDYLSIAQEVNTLFDSAVAGIENTRNKELALKHKNTAEEYLAKASVQVATINPADTTLETNFKTSLSEIIGSLNELDSAFAIVNPCPEKGEEVFYTDSNGQRTINLSMVNRFKLSWNQANAPLTYDSYTYQSKERDLFKWTDISRLWSNYRFAQTEKSDTSGGISPNDNPATKPSVASNAETTKETYRLGELRSAGGSDGSGGGKIKNLVADKDSKTATNKKTSSTDRSYQSTIAASQDASKSEASESDKAIAAYSSGTLSADFFTVQIAANTKPLDTQLLKVLYKGSFTIEERLEDGWYRYIVGRFFDVNAAVLHLFSSSIEVGMVTAYKGDARTIVKTKSHTPQSLSTQEGLIAVYRVQIAAAKKPIPAKVLHSLRTGIRPINVYAEDGWFRYSIGDYLLYSDAISVRDSCGVFGAFVMPYINGVRQPLKGKQIILREEVKRERNPVFVVQLAATKRPISLKKLKVYRKNGIPVTLHIEEGWYKYTSDVFFSKDLAQKKVKEMKVPGAFVVTYLNGKRVNP